MITAKLDLAPLFKKLRDTPALLHAELQSKLTSESRLLVSSSGKIPGMVQVTPPFSDGVKGIAAKKQGEAKVAGDIRKAYGTPGDLWRLIRDRAGQPVADNFWAYMKLGRWHQANAIAQKHTGHGLDVFDAGAEHRRRRNPRTGRVIGGGRPSDKKFFFAPTQKKAFDAYIKRQSKNVGLTASSLPTAAGARLGAISGIPAWVKRHAGRWGMCKVTQTNRSFMVQLGLTSRGGSEMQRRFNAVLGYRLKALQRQLPYIKRAALKKARLAQVA